jgi:hypothetical protein
MPLYLEMLCLTFDLAGLGTCQMEQPAKRAAVGRIFSTACFANVMQRSFCLIKTEERLLLFASPSPLRGVHFIWLFSCRIGCESGRFRNDRSRCDFGDRSLDA